MVLLFFKIAEWFSKLNIDEDIQFKIITLLSSKESKTSQNHCTVHRNKAQGLLLTTQVLFQQSMLHTTYHKGFSAMIHKSCGHVVYQIFTIDK